MNPELLDTTLCLRAAFIAYIGPGAGFALVSSLFFLLLSFALAFLYLLYWPFRITWKALLGPRLRSREGVRRVVILGLDGLDPGLASKYMEEGKLPRLRRLKEAGSFSPLATSFPSISPVAWSSFMTGVEPSHHNIYDFITRDPCTCQPLLSSAEIGRASRVLPIGKYMVPLSKPRVKLLRKSQPFWKILGKKGILSSVLRVPITFPPEKMNGVLLSGMCTPDLRGSQGTFSFYTTDRSDRRARTGGTRYHVSRRGDRVETFLHGPRNDLKKGGEELRIPLSLRVDPTRERLEVEVDGQRFELEVGVHSPWIQVRFRPGLGMRIHGICRFLVTRLQPELELYVTPIHIDPERPALPISHPAIYSVYMAKMIGPFGTLGLAEDTWALNERVIDEDAFLQQSWLLCEERERMLFEALRTTPRGLVTCVFDTTDRVQHMFFRCLDETHPANRGKEVEKYRNVIENLYVRADALVGRVMEELGDGGVLIVMSDHGFTQFRRGVNVNTWLYRNGYLALEEGALEEGDAASGEWFQGVDWSRTRAFALGLSGIFINRRGRESCGIVEEGRELAELKRELREKLERLVDPETGGRAIRRVVDTAIASPGPYTHDAPDLLIGYESGYRNSWSCATGKVSAEVFEDNTRSWSGDHCVDPELVPGVLFCSRKLSPEAADIKDIAPTVLDMFGVEIPAYMKGKSLVVEPDQAGSRPLREVQTAC